MQDRFVVTHIDTTTGAGFVRQVTSKDRQVLTRPVAFDARHLCEAFDHPQDGIAIRTPSRWKATPISMTRKSPLARSTAVRFAASAATASSLVRLPANSPVTSSSGQR
jgi:hypothetical protein